MMKPVVSKRDEPALRVFAEALPHSLIVGGERGLDQELVVDYLSKYNPSDIFTLTKQDKKNTIGIDQIREVVSTLRTYSDRRRVIIIRLAEHMTEAAQNALLKAIEDPSGNTHFILESENYESLLPTIRSRCQLLLLHRTNSLQDNSILKQCELSSTDIKQIIFLASGRPRLIRFYAMNPKKLADKRQVVIDANQLILGGSYDRMAIANRYSSNREDALTLVDAFLTLLSFQLRSGNDVSKLTYLIEKASLVKNRLSTNGHVKLSLVQLAI